MTRPPRRPPPAALALLAALGACGGDGMLVPRAPDFAVVPIRLELAPGDTARLAAQLDRRPAGGVQFLSRGTVASVSGTGLVTALTPGVGAVTAVETREGIHYTIPVIVRGVRLRLDGREVGAALRLAPGTVGALNATVYGGLGRARDTLRWTSSDSAVATVSPDGTLHAGGPGRATLTVASSADPFLHATTTVEVSGAPGLSLIATTAAAGDSASRKPSSTAAAATPALAPTSLLAPVLAASPPAPHVEEPRGFFGRVLAAGGAFAGRLARVLLP